MSVVIEVSRLAAAHDGRGHPMSISSGFYRDFSRQDGITFRSLPATHPSDHEYVPEGVLSDGHLDVGKNGDVTIVRLGKNRVLDELTVNKIGDELLGVADRPDCHRLLLDFSGVAQLSSAMLTKLLTLRRKMEAKGENLRLCGIDSHLRSVFAITRLDRIFDILDTEPCAIKAVASQSPQFAEKVI